MTFRPAPGVCECRLEWRVNDQAVYNYLHIGTNPVRVWTEGDYDSVWNNSVGGMWGDIVVELVPTTAQFIGAQFTDLGALTGLQQRRYWDPNANYGNYPAPPAPNNVSLAITLATAERYHGSRGRFFIPAIPTDQLVGDAVYTGWAFQWVLGLQEFANILPYAPPGAFLAVLSRRRNGAWLPEAVPMPVTEIFLVNNAVDSQRDRLTGHRAQRRHVSTP